MRYAIAALLMLAVLASAQWAGPAPIGKEENSILYTWDGWDREVYQDNVGMFSVSESVNGADSVAVYFDVLSSTYDHYECYFWVSMTGDATDEDMTGHVNIYPEGGYATATAADTLNWVNLHDSGDAFGKVYYTITTDGTAYQVGRLVPGETWQTPCVIWVDGTVATDSTGFVIEAIVSDSCEVNITGLAIPRT